MSIFLSLIFRVPFEVFFSSLYAEDEPYHDLVALIVEEDIYPDLKTEIVRYSRDIQSYRENTKVAIFPTPKTASVYDIASLSEALYFQWYKVHEDVSFESRLVGTVFIGDIPLPLVFDNGASAKSVLPYVDFVEKQFIFDHENQKYQRADQATNTFEAEIWHGFISPNTGTRQGNIEAIQNYFDKNHDFYTGEGLFSEEKNIINGTVWEMGKDYEPYVFYYDQFRENEALQYQKYAGYEMYSEHKDDMIYNRYSQELAEEVKNHVLWTQDEDISGLVEKAGIDLSPELFSTGPDTNTSSDVVSRYITNNTSNRFLETFNASSLWEMRKNVYNAGRYNQGGRRVNMDSPAFLISQLDEIHTQILKDASDALEEEITQIVKNGLSRNIPIRLEKTQQQLWQAKCISRSHTFYYGKIAHELESAADCSIYRGSGNHLVEANRAYNVQNTEADLELCRDTFVSGDSWALPVTKWYWWGNTPLNLKVWESENYGDFELNGASLSSSIVPLFDILGSKSVSDLSKTPSPLDCYDAGVYVETYRQYQESRTVWKDENEREEYFCVEGFQLPVLGNEASGSWSCRTDNNVSTYTPDYEERFLEAYGTSGECNTYTLNINGDTNTISKQHDKTCRTAWQGDNERIVCSCENVEWVKQYKTIPSYILHTSPTDEEFALQSQSRFTPALPIDSVRYIDYIWANGRGENRGYQRIDFPQLFSLKHTSQQGVDIDSARELLTAHLSQVSESINQNIRQADPSILTPWETALYESLSSGVFPEADVDLTKFLQNKPQEVFSQNGQSKELSYYDTVVFAIFWNNLTSVSSKYQFLFENYMSNEFEGNDYDFHLPKAKTNYEIAYFSAPGDAQNMYINFDPEKKATHPYTNTLEKNLTLQTALRASRPEAPQQKQEEAVFSCAPPEGVDISQWPSAIICWLEEMLPPTIQIAKNDFRGSSFTPEQAREIDKCSTDENKNGVLDCYEQKLQGGSLKLSSRQSKYSYNTTGILQADIYQKNGEKAFFDNQTSTRYLLQRLEISQDITQELTGTNTKIIFDRDQRDLSGDQALAQAQEYISYSTAAQRNMRWESQNYISTPAIDANIYFIAELDIKDSTAQTLLNLKSNELKIEVRGDRITTTSRTFTDEEGADFWNSALVSESPNIYVIHSSDTEFEKWGSELSQLSNSSEKLLVDVQNISPTWAKNWLNYPLSISLYKGDEKIFEEVSISQTDVSQPKEIFTAQESWIYELIIEDADGFVASQNIDIRAEKARVIQPSLSTSIMEVGGNVSQHFLTLEDGFGNIANSDVYKLEISLQWGGLVFEENDTAEIEYHIIEWYKLMGLKSTDTSWQNTIQFRAYDLSGKLIDEKTRYIRTVEHIKPVLTQKGAAAKVWGEEYLYSLEFQDENGNIYSDVYSRVYASLPSIYGQITDSYTEVRAGKAEISFISGFTAGEEIPLEIHLEWGNDIFTKNITLLPEEPVYIDIAASKTKMQASSQEVSLVEATLKDKYGNTVFNDNTTTISAQVHENSKNIISFSDTSQVVEKWISQFRVYGGSVSGTWFFELQADAWLENIDFQIGDIDFQWISEGAGEIETFFFWDKQSIEEQSYNSVYSILFGGPYGDISQEDYLAGALIFERDNVSLGATTLLSESEKWEETLSFLPNGGLSLNSSEDLTQDIDVQLLTDDSGRLILDIQNTILREKIARVYYLLSEETEIDISLLASDYEIVQEAEKYFLQSAWWKTLFEIDESGKMYRKNGASLSLDKSFSGEWLQLFVEHGGEKVMQIQLQDDVSYDVTRDQRVLETKLNISKDTVIIHLQSQQYSSDYSERENRQDGVSFFYRDPFSLSSSTQSIFHNEANLGGEFIEEQSIGWDEANAMILELSSGSSLWEATQIFPSFSLINIGDPLISLPSQKQYFQDGSEKSFDRSLWTTLAKDEDFIDYRTFDYNADNHEDILMIDRQGFLFLIENTGDGWYLAQRNYAYAADAGSSNMLQTGDFFGDSYDDIFFVSDTGTPEMFHNDGKKLERISIQENFDLKGSVIQTTVFDMDRDGRSDIVTLDDAGEIYIFYGAWDTDNPRFEKSFLWDGHQLSLWEETISHGGAVYFDGLVQPKKSSNITSNFAEDYLKEVEENIDALQSSSANIDTPVIQSIDDTLLASLSYASLPYTPTNFKPQETDQQWDEVFVQQGYGEFSDFAQAYNDHIIYEPRLNTSTQESSFLLSQYGENVGLEITKTFIDDTPEILQTGEVIRYQVSFTNTSSQRKDNIAYADTLPDYFQVVGNDFYVLWTDGSRESESRKLKTGVWSYDILIDEFFLDAWEELTIEIDLEVLAVSYAHIEAWLFESGEVGDDNYGDVRVRQSEYNCWDDAEVYRSEWSKEYSLAQSQTSCEEGHDMWEEYSQFQDSNQNDIPDYLEGVLTTDQNGTIIPSDDQEALNEYIQQVSVDMFQDSDGDGIMDSDDSMDNTPSSSWGILWSFEKLNEGIDEVSAGIDELIQWLSCGFGGGSCFANPLNWAPLAPGNDPTLFGIPIGDGLHVNEGVPIFSALTGMQASCWLSPCCLPSVYPAHSQWYVPWPFCGPPSAWGSLWTWASTNFVRMFATPTLTGGFGLAVCFWWPAIVAWNSNPMWVYPLVPGGNCIVTAQPLFWCEEGFGNPWGLGFPWSWDFWVLHANCQGSSSESLDSPTELSSDFMDDYLTYLSTDEVSEEMYADYIDELKFISQNSGTYNLPTKPFIQIWWSQGVSEISVSLDTEKIRNRDFSDIVQVQNKAVGGFPGFMMNWVDQQLDEITSKLTNLPKIYVILPDFWGIFDYSFAWFGDGLQEVFEIQQQSVQDQRQTDAQRKRELQEQKNSLDCSGSDALQCSMIELQVLAQTGQGLKNSSNETLSGIKEVYEFVGNIPLVDIESETIQVNIPWIDETELNRTILNWKLTSQSWQDERQRAAEQWSLWKACDKETPAEQERCERENDIRNKLYLQSWALISSLEQNIAILEEYKKFPERLASLINIREVWLWQILYNIEILSNLMWDWLKKNGQRFKAWVELYILIKAILKSWQLFIDVFIGYEAECQECKNERQDLQDFIFQLISVVLPTPPIIEFPSWPDIILDFHNIRAWMTIYLPDFDISLRPIVLPTLPDLFLPEFPELWATLPSLPLLPIYTLPELPDLPVLPAIELPHLPPPPQIPQIFGSVEIVLDIMKLIIKTMCLIKGSPFVPEWRAWDQIAFLTERNGYLPTDFLDIQFPSFSYSTISAIRVTNYVNFEFETEFLIEIMRSVTAPLDAMTNNITQMFDIRASDINLRNATPSDININTKGFDISYKEEVWAMIAGILTRKILSFLENFSNASSIYMDNDEFITHVSQGLIASVWEPNSGAQELQHLWKSVRDRETVIEDALIQDLQNHNQEKFDLLQNILTHEIQEIQKLQERLRNRENPESFIQIRAQSSNSKRDIYKHQLAPYNSRSLESIIALADGEDHFTTQLESELKQETRTIEKFIDERRLFAQDSSWTQWWETHWASCRPDAATDYQYEWIYVVEEDKNYQLFDYTDFLDGDEEPYMKDMDNDGDEDILYFSSGTLYYKDNYSSAPETSENHISWAPLVQKSSQNTFFNGESYVEALNYFSAETTSDGFLNFSFAKPSDDRISQFRIYYHSFVDAYMRDRENEKNEVHIIDALDLSQNGDAALQQNIAYIHSLWNTKWVRLTQEKLVSLRQELANNTTVVLTANSPLYAGNRSFEIEYLERDGSRKKQKVMKYQNIRFPESIEIQGLSWDAYVWAKILEDITDVSRLQWIPLLPGAVLKRENDASLYTSSSQIDIVHADGSYISLDMQEVSSYRIYELAGWVQEGENYSVRVPQENGMYYARAEAFSWDLPATISQQILLAPQEQADVFAPQIGYSDTIRVPVYQTHTINMTPYIYEDGGLWGIEKFWLDADLTQDSDGDGDPRNDFDEENISVSLSPARIEITFGPYEELFEKQVALLALDNNGNLASSQVTLEVYSPTPLIQSVEDSQIQWVIDEELSWNPVSLYRYRWWVLQQLSSADWSGVSVSESGGNYSFDVGDERSWLYVEYQGTTLAEIDEYTGQIDIQDPLARIRVLASNDEANSSVYPELQIQRAGELVFRQYIYQPQGETQLIWNRDIPENPWMYLRLLDQEEYSIARVPLGVSYNPGSMMIFRWNDTRSQPVMTVFQDGRVHTRTEEYELLYRNVEDQISLILVNKETGLNVAQLIYSIDGSYILR